MATRKSPKLTAAARKRMPASSFGLPKVKKYPLNTKKRARNALARVSQHGTAPQKAQVRRAVKRKYPSIQVSGLGGKKGRRRSR